MRPLILLFFALSAAPIFFSPKTLRLNIVDAFVLGEGAFSIWEKGLSLHVVTLVAALLVAVTLVRSLPKLPIYFSLESILVMVLVVNCTLAMMYGMLVKPAALNVVYYCQAMLPISLFFVGAHEDTDSATVRKGIALLMWGVTLAVPVVLLLFLRVSGLGLGSAVQTLRRLSLILPQFQNYYPFIIATSFSFLLFTAGGGNRRLLLLGTIAHVAFMMISWSRTGWVMFLVVVASKLRRLSVGALVVVLIGMFFVLTQLNDQADTGVSKHLLVTKRKNTVHGDGNRLAWAKEGLQKVAHSPLLGQMFIPEEEQNVSKGTAGVPKLFLPHNQFIDFGLKGGVGGMLAFISLIGVSFVRVRRFRKNCSHEGQQRLLEAWQTILVFAALGCFTQVYFTQAFTACPMWFFLGFFSKYGHPRLAD